MKKAKMPKNIKKIRRFGYGMGIGGKVVLFVFMSALIVMTINGFLGYFRTRALLESTVEGEYVQMSKMLADSISEHINSNIEELRILLSTFGYVNAVQMANSAYGGMDEESIQEQLLEIDKRWIESGDGGDLMQKYLGSTVSLDLARHRVEARHIGEVFLTDKHGGVVAASNRTSDFYQADEEWWQESFAGGSGEFYVGDVEFDKSADMLSISFAVPMRDVAGKVIGVGKMVVNLKEFFKSIASFGLGNTGRAVLIDGDNDILVYRGAEPLSRKFTSDEDFRKLLSSKNKSITVGSSEFGGNKKVIVAAEVDNSFLQKSDILWMVCIEQDVKELLSPIGALLKDTLIFFILSLILLIPLAYFFSKLFIRPIKELQNATNHIARGELDYNINITTGDEIQELAEHFNKMTGKLKKTTTSIEALNEEISQREKAEEQIKNSAAEWASTFDSIPDLISIQDKDFKLVKVNKAYAEVFKMSPKELEGHTCYELVHGTTEPVEMCPAKELINTKKSKRSEYFEPHLGIWLEVLATPIFDKKGELDKIVHVTRDISARKETEKDMEDLAKFPEENPNPVLRVTDNGTVLYANRAGKSILNSWTTKEGEPFPDVWKNLFKRAIEEGVSLYEEDDIGGDIFSFDISPVKDSGYANVYGKNITEKRRAEELLMENVRLKSNFTATVSHELRTPLTAIKEGIGIVLDGSTGEVNEDQKDFLLTAKKNVDRLTRLINDVLDFTKLEAGKVLLKIKKIDLGEIVDEVVRSHKVLADEKGIGLRAEIEPNIPSIEADSDRIIQVITNLVGNALKFTTEGEIVIRAINAEKGKVQISVEDTGSGMKKEDLSKLFEEFRQLEDKNERKTGGTGLGLAISKKIVENHRGEIWVESEPGKGASFIFTLPIETRQRILVVDDDTEVLKVYTKLLEKNGYDVAVAETGMEGIKGVRDKKPDLIVLDMVLPDISGYEVIGRLRADKDFAEIPIIAVSGYEEGLKELDKLDEGPEGAALPRISKPFDNEAFLDIIRTYLGRLRV